MAEIELSALENRNWCYDEGGGCRKALAEEAYYYFLFVYSSPILMKYWCWCWWWWWKCWWLQYKWFCIIVDNCGQIMMMMRVVANWGYQSSTLRASSQGAEFFWPSNPSNQFQSGTSTQPCMPNSFFKSLNSPKISSIGCFLPIFGCLRSNICSKSICNVQSIRRTATSLPAHPILSSAL